ncbi:MAG: filamentous hemagglutinin family protein [Candidatus Sphingomonas phytovorans]|nr:filamentous haemagglutinin family protein [Sphingomonas sp.]WEK02140.1 MAG: filamentous hemagglutinin family protein [Sphingomonas sp.]
MSNLRNALLSGTSLVTMLVAQPALAQTASSIRGTAATGAASGGSGSAGNSGATVTTLPPTAQAALTRQNALKARVATAMDLANQAQAAARSAALAKPSTVPNGLVIGGLVPAGAITSNPALWQNAKAPTQIVGADGKITVEIGQTASKAILTWDSFNVGKDTTVYFNQSAGKQSDGSNEWIALNRINDPSLSPSQIQGQIKAEGSVYLINRNGILFSGTSQVNTHSLIASSLSFFGEDSSDPASVALSNKAFLDKGLSGVLFTFHGANGAGIVLGSNNQDAPMSAGAITIEAGAQIETGANGFSIIAAPKLTNAGSVVANGGGGQAILAATQGLLLGSSTTQLSVTATGGYTTPADKPTLINTGIVAGIRGAVTLLGNDVTQNGVVTATTSIQQTGSITITAQRTASTYANALVDRQTVLTFGSNALTAILPDANGGSTTSSPAADIAFKPGTANFNAGSIWFQQNSVLYMPGATVTAVTPNFDTNYPDNHGDGAFGRIWIDKGATLSVAGLADVQRPMSDNIVTVPRVGQNELADSPLQRNGILYKSPFTVDSRDSGTRSGGLSWVGSPTVGANGYVQGQTRGIEQMLVNGGTINLAASGDLIVAKNSSIDVSGGFLHYLGGSIQTSRLIGDDGRIYDAATADPMIKYVGFAGQTSIAHSRWGVTDNFTNRLMTGGYESDYVAGGNGGTLATFSGGTTFLSGALLGETVIGRHQIADGKLPRGATLDLGNSALLRLAFAGQASAGAIGSFGGGFLLTRSGVGIEDFIPDYGFDTSIRTSDMLAKPSSDTGNLLYTSNISTDLINAGGFTNVLITGSRAPITLAQGAAITVQPRGTITLSGGALDIEGALTARSGQINLIVGTRLDGANTGQLNPLFSNIDINLPIGTVVDRAAGDLVLGDKARLDVSGLWINDTGMVDGQGSNFTNGGSVSMQTMAVLGSKVMINYLQGVKTKTDYPSYVLDKTGAILLKPGSVIDASSGGYVDTLGRVLMDGAVPAGKGGDISMNTYVVPSGTGNSVTYDISALGTNKPVHSIIELGSTLLSYGFAGGGTLTLGALDIQIGGAQAGLPDYTLYLPADFFTQGGFGAYKLSAAYGAKIADGTAIRLSQRNYVADPTALSRLATGGDVSSVASIGTVEAYYRQPTNFSLSAGSYLLWSVSGQAGGRLVPDYAGVTGATFFGAGASIVGDPGASISLSSFSNLTALGSITAHGGSIALTNDFSRISATNPYALDHGVWLGADATLDASGVALTDPIGQAVRGPNGEAFVHGGRVLDGGSVSLTAYNGYVAAEAGARIDVSGSSGSFDLRGENGKYAPTAVWSDAGSVTLGGTNGLYFDATLVAHGGAPAARGGTLTLAQINKRSVFGNINYSPDALLLQQSGTFLSTNAQAGDALGIDHTMHFALDRLAGSGIDTLVLGADTMSENSFSTRPSMTIGFVGNLDIALDRAVIANANNFVLLPAGTNGLPSNGVALPATDTHVSISAGYVGLGGNYSPLFATFTPIVAGGGATFDVHAGAIDLMGQFNIQNAAGSRFVADGDIRLFTPSAYSYLPNNSTTIPGTLVTGGDLTFQAAQIYPATGNVFVLSAPTVGSTITFLGNGKSSPLPLSVGGALLVDAANIVQNGVLRAPSGTIQLGVGDPTDADTKKAFGNVPLVRTQSVTLGAGSLTSVSLDGRSLPYGTTTDGTDWRLVIDGFTSPDLTQAPQKFIGIAGNDVTLAKNATVDLSGGGGVYAQEFVPGTGGSRDLLKAVNTVYSTGATPQQVPLYADGRPVYAVIPGYSGPVAAYDPSFGGTGSDIGKSVYLSGVPGLPDGVYTLLPGQYATVKGAFRVVQQTQITDSIARDDFTQYDGSRIVSGRFVDGITGKQDARTTSFLVQSANVWKQYSEYTITDADKYFPALAAHSGKNAGRTAVDAGQLVLAAVNALTLDGKLNSTPGTGGRGAAVDIAAQDIQIIGGSGAARAGYLQVNAVSLTGLGAESLLIGGTRTDTADGTVVKAVSNSVILSNDTGSALTGPEILFVSATDASGSDPNAANGLLIESGSVLAAKGTIAAGSTIPLLIGATGGASGDGALLRVSNGAAVPVIRANVPGLGGVAGTTKGLLDIRAGASIDGGNSVILDSTGDFLLAPGATFAGKAVDINANSVAFVGSGSQATPAGLVVDSALIARFANITTLGFHSRSTMDFYGNVDLDSAQNLSLGAAAFSSDGGTVSINAPTLSLVNDLGGQAVFAGGTGTLKLSAGELDLGVGAKTLRGFGTVTATATKGIVGQGNGSLDLGSLDVTMTAPVFTTDTGADSRVVTTGTLTLATGAGTAIQRETLGGAWTFSGGALVDAALILAPAGNVSLHATSGDLTIGEGAKVMTAGVAKPFRDVTAYAPAGAIALTADKGKILLAQGATLDFSGTAKGGDAGSLTVSAPTQNVNLLGTLRGNAATGYVGGSLSLDVGGSVDLDSLATRLADSGVTQAVAVRSRAGNLILSNGKTLTARTVTLTADGATGMPGGADGNVLIAGTINAAGPAGGSITLAGRSGVTMTGSLIATGSDPAQRGGSVRLMTGGVANGSLDPTYGYELIDAAGSGTIRVGAGAVIDVSGGTAGGLSGGTVAIRAPLLANGDVNVTIDPGATIKGARDVGLEAYAVWSTADTQQTDKSKYFDGIIDPAGWYGADGKLVAGTWTDMAGNALPDPTDDAELKAYLATNLFTPTTPNADHQTFYGYLNGDEDAAVAGTLMGFIRNPGFTFENRFASIANFHARPGVELRNPDPTINGGAISILTAWNLGAGTSPNALAFRYNDQAPILSLRAQGNIDARASLTDGFWQYATATGAGGKIIESDFATIDPAWQTLKDSVFNGISDTSLLYAPADNLVGDSTAIGQYYGLYQKYLDFLNLPGAFSSINNGIDLEYTMFFAGGSIDPTNPPPTPPATANDYTNYLKAYTPYFNKVIMGLVNGESTPSDFQPLLPPPTTLDIVIAKPPVANGPAPINIKDNPLPLSSAVLAGGVSSSYRLIAGADFASSDPITVQAISAAALTIDGHISWATDGGTINVGTMIRTGTGGIDIISAGDIALLDKTAPGTIYAAGRPAAGTIQDTLHQSVLGTNAIGVPTLITGEVHPEAGGDVTIRAGGSISGNEQIYADTGRYAAQFWWPWMATGNAMGANDSTGASEVKASSINFGAFGQGAMSIGGNVSVSAAGDIREFSVSLPTTWYQATDASGAASVTYVGGGNLSVQAGGDILGGSYFVSKGQGRIDTNGSIGSAFTLTAQGYSSPVSTLLALQDAVLTVSARGTADIGGIYNPSWLKIPDGADGSRMFSDGQSYSPRSAINLSSTSGDVRLDTLRLPRSLFGYGNKIYENTEDTSNSYGRMLPASLAVMAFDGSLYVGGAGELYPSTTGNLQLLASGSIQFTNDIVGQLNSAAEFGMSDAPTSYLPSPLNPIGNLSFWNTLFNGGDRFLAHQAGLHAADTQPVRIYSLTGDIVDGAVAADGSFYAGFVTNGMRIVAPKVTQIYAGGDVANLYFLGTNLYASDVTNIVAGRDIYDTPLPTSFLQLNVPVSAIEIAGPGSLDITAGRDLGPLAGNKPVTGLRAVGDLYNARIGRGSADISVLFGTAPGVAWDDFASAYLAPGAKLDGIPGFDNDLIGTVAQYQADQDKRAGGTGAKPTLTADQAWAIFKTLPDAQRQALIEKAFFRVLQTTGADYNDPASRYYGKYARGYQAIEALFPAKLGYTKNNLEGGANGAATQVTTGNLDMRGSTIQTEQGGNINILGPGGRILVGSTGSPPYLVDGQTGAVLVGPQAMGILAWETGNVNIFSDQSLLLAQSRIFTERGGDMTIWSSNGDINAGKGAKTSTEQPPLRYVCTPDYFCRIDSGAAVSGAGIAAFSAGENDLPLVTLVAPRGTVDFGDAGVRAGNLIVAAQAVANADNVQVKGTTIGVPTNQANVSANLAASSTAANAAQEAATAMQKARQNDQPSVVIVTINGFG